MKAKKNNKLSANQKTGLFKNFYIDIRKNKVFDLLDKYRQGVKDFFWKRISKKSGNKNNLNEGNKVLHRVSWLLFLSVLITLTGFNLSIYLNSRQVVTYAKIENDAKKIEFWNVFLESHPGYFEGWVEVAKLELKGGDIVSARYALDKARKLKPNSEVLRAIKEDLVDESSNID